MTENKNLKKPNNLSIASNCFYKNNNFLNKKDTIENNNLQRDFNKTLEIELSPDYEFTKCLKKLKTLDGASTETMQKRTFTKWINYHLEMVFIFFIKFF